MRKLIAAALCSLMLAACAFNPPPRFDPTLYPRTHQAFDFSFFWRADQTSDIITISGFLTNRIYFKIRDVYVSAVLLNSAGDRIGKEVVSFVLGDVAMDDYAYFNLPLPFNAVDKPERARIYYRYNQVERDSGVLPQYHSFDITL